MKRKILTAAAFLAAVFCCLPVCAEEYTADGTGDCRVSAVVGSSYSVKVPAVLELQYNNDSGKYEGSYTVSARGNILPSQSVTVRPTAGSFPMAGTLTGETCQASVRQEITQWVHPSRLAGSGKQHISAEEYTGSTGWVSAALTVPDTYTGEFTIAFTLGEYAE